MTLLMVALLSFNTSKQIKRYKQKHSSKIVTMFLLIKKFTLLKIDKNVLKNNIKDYKNSTTPLSAK